MSENVANEKRRKKPDYVTREEFEALRTLVHQLVSYCMPAKVEEAPRQKFR